MEHPSNNSIGEQGNIEVVHGSGSVAHQIIGEFLVSLEKQEEYIQIAQQLKLAIFDKKPTETSLRDAMFGESEL